MNSPRWLQNSVTRFLLAGALNTAITLCIFVALLQLMPSTAAWVVAFLCGIAFVNVVYPRFVFRGKVNPRSVTGNTSYYVFALAVSEGVLILIERGIHVDPRLAGVIVAIVMIPINYFAARYFSSPRREK